MLSFSAKIRPWKHSIRRSLQSAFVEGSIYSGTILVFTSSVINAPRTENYELVLLSIMSRQLNDSRQGLTWLRCLTNCRKVFTNASQDLEPFWNDRISTWNSRWRDDEKDVRANSFLIFYEYVSRHFIPLVCEFRALFRQPFFVKRLLIFWESSFCVFIFLRFYDGALSNRNRILMGPRLFDI